MLWVRISIMARCKTLCDKVCQWLATGRWFSPGPLVSSTNTTDRHDITEILLEVALNTINQTDKLYIPDNHLSLPIFISTDKADKGLIMLKSYFLFLSQGKPDQTYAASPSTMCCRIFSPEIIFVNGKLSIGKSVIYSKQNIYGVCC